MQEVTGTESFLTLSQEQRGGCQLEEREVCQTKVIVLTLSWHLSPQAYLATKREECGCWPLGWAVISGGEVGSRSRSRSKSRNRSRKNNKSTISNTTCVVLAGSTTLHSPRRQLLRQGSLCRVQLHRAVSRPLR